MKRNKPIALFALLLAGSIAAVAAPDPNFHIFLCFGQSNMEGGGRIEEGERTVDPRFQALADFDQPDRGRTLGRWHDAVPPLTRRTRGISLVDAFGRTMVANLPSAHRVGVVKLGVAGTRIELWDKDAFRSYLAALPAADTWKTRIANEYDGNPYAYLVKLAKIAQRDGVIKGILIHQGESNFQDDEWPNKVKKIHGDLVRDLGLDPAQVPLLAGEVVHADQRGEKANANVIMRRLPEVLPTAQVISSAGIPCNPDRLHFTPDGQRELGRRYAEAMLRLMGHAATGSAVSAGKGVAQP